MRTSNGNAIHLPMAYVYAFLSDLCTTLWHHILELLPCLTTPHMLSQRTECKMQGLVSREAPEVDLELDAEACEKAGVIPLLGSPRRRPASKAGSGLNSMAG